MEQAYRRLKTELLNNPLVDDVDLSYLYIIVTWKSGIKERLVTKRFLNRNSLVYYSKSKIRPWFMPPAMWWEDLSNGLKPMPHYLDNVEYEDDLDKYSNLINWKWSDYKKAKFFERLITVHEIFQYIIDNGWKEQKYPEHSLTNSLQLVYNEKLQQFKLKRSGYKTRSYPRLAERPAQKLLEHFMPYGFYGRDDPYYYMSTKTPRSKKRVYLAIRNIINRNYALEKKGRKKFFDFNYNNILKMMRLQHRSSIRVAPYSIRQINLFVTIMKDLDLEGKSFYDVNPMMGELHIAAHVLNCPYYYRESIPFDQGSKELSKFINSHCEIDEGNSTYDFGIYDGNFFFDYDRTQHAFELLNEKTNLAMIFIPNEFYDKWISEHKKHDDEIKLMISRNKMKCGRLLLYYC